MKSLIAALALLSSVAHAIPVYGEWVFADTQVFPGFTISQIMKIEATQVTATNICKFKGVEVDASVTVPAVVTADSIVIAKGASVEEPMVGGECVSEMPAGTFKYALSADGNQIVFNGDSRISAKRKN